MVAVVEVVRGRRNIVAGDTDRWFEVMVWWVFILFFFLLLQLFYFRPSPPFFLLFFSLFGKADSLIVDLFLASESKLTLSTAYERNCSTDFSTIHDLLGFVMTSFVSISEQFRNILEIINNTSVTYQQV